MGDLPNCERYEKFSVGLSLMGDLPVHEKTWKFFNIDLIVMGDLSNCKKYKDFSVGLVLMGNLLVHEKLKSFSTLISL
jgi:hypothetical protein